MGTIRSMPTCRGRDRCYVLDERGAHGSDPGTEFRASFIAMRPLVVPCGRCAARTAVVAAAMAVAGAACVANVRGSAPIDASPSTTPDSAAEVRAEVMPIERW